MVSIGYDDGLLPDGTLALPEPIIIISKLLWHSPEGNFRGNAQHIFPRYVLARPFQLPFIQLAPTINFFISYFMFKYCKNNSWDLKIKGWKFEEIAFPYDLRNSWLEDKVTNLRLHPHRPEANDNARLQYLHCICIGDTCIGDLSPSNKHPRVHLFVSFLKGQHDCQESLATTVFVKGIKNGCPCIVEIRGTQGCALVGDPARAVGECRDVAKAQP